jgi:hypothetical protein
MLHNCTYSLERSYAWPPQTLSLLHFQCQLSPFQTSRTTALLIIPVLPRYENTASSRSALAYYSLLSSLLVISASVRSITRHNTKEMVYLWVLNVDGKIISKLILRQRDVCVSNEFKWFTTESSGGFLWTRICMWDFLLRTLLQGVS